jgi:chitodextrinase
VQGTELYNASTGTFTTSGNMTIGRSSHTATLLSDGSVLVTGGNYFAGKTATAEVYDSVAGTFAPVGSMTEARVGHTATLLNNGLVLIVGGAYPDTQSSELYQPTTAPRIATISPTFGSTGTVVSIAGINFGSTQGSSTVQFGSVTASPTSWSKTQIVVPVPPGIFAVHTQIIVTVKGVVSNSASFLMPPQISGILPAAGPIGVTTTITGVGFGLSAGTVQFNGTAATPKLWSDNQIVVPVPTGAATGNVSVTVSGVTSNPVAFTVDSPGTSSYTGSMLQPWSFPLTQTATVLNNGMVLIIGGGNGTDAELYNPSTGTFTETGSLNNARTYFTATLLSNGMVLVAGGRVYNSSFTTITSAELYNPTTGTFTNTGGLNMRRAQHTATLLNNGMVLIAGGRGDYTTTVPTDVTQAELYNPATGSFALTGSLNIARMGHTATLLGNNQVIIMGGWNDGPNSSTEGFVGVSELYNPATGVFTSTTELNTWRYNHTATVLSNGKILIVGGILGYSSSGYICYPTCPPSELYDPVANQFSNSGFLITQRENHTATLLSSGNVLVTGGDNGQPFGSPYYQALANVEIYNLSSGTFAAGENLNVARSGHTATLLSNGEVLIAGGDVNGIAELYQVSQTAIPGQPSAPSNLAASAVSNSQINLSWTAPTSGSGLSYVIFRNGIPIASNVPVTSYQDTGLISNTTYSYQVEAMASSGTLSGESLASNSVVATTIPSAPTNLTATPVSSAQINLSWTASAGPGLTYTLLRNGSPIATGMTGTSYSDSGLAGAARYSYEVEAVNLSGTSAPSNIANVTQPTVFGTSPAGAPSGSLITIEGEDFGSAQGSVFIGGNAAAVQVWGSTAIVVVVPTALPPGLVGVQVANFQGASNVVPFTITVAGCPTN